MGSLFPTASSLDAHSAFGNCGNAVAGDGCREGCDAMELGWACRTPGSACNAVCGDGALSQLEQCDDNNTLGGDGCGAQCEIEIGYACVSSASETATVLCVPQRDYERALRAC